MFNSLGRGNIAQAMMEQRRRMGTFPGLGYGGYGRSGRYGGYGRQSFGITNPPERMTGPPISTGGGFIGLDPIYTKPIQPIGGGVSMPVPPAPGQPYTPPAPSYQPAPIFDPAPQQPTGQRFGMGQEPVFPGGKGVALGRGARAF
jgi:hypothetical protein